MDSLKDLLTNKDIDEPSEITAIKNYCQNNFKFTPKVSVKNDQLWLVVPNGILATEVRMRQQDIKMRCALTKKLFIRIG